MKISDETVRNNPSAKDEVCRWVGSDIRIQNYCADSDQGPDNSNRKSRRTGVIFFSAGA